MLEDYNYFINKAVQQYINLIYAKLEVDQQSTDDIRVLKASTVLKPIKFGEDETVIEGMQDGIFKSSYYAYLPGDYMHLLNCVIGYEVAKADFKCYKVNDRVYFAARRLTPNMFTQILNNAYMRPMYKRPYYYLTNINEKNDLVTNTTSDEGILNYSAKEEGNVASSLRDSQNVSGDRLANPSRVRLELRFGNDDSVFVPKNIYIDYLKAPMYIRLTQEQIDMTFDKSQVLEFPDYVCFEIVNIFTRLIMENASDPRLQTNMPINNTIVSPMQQAQVAQQQANRQ